jgi:ubiquinone/menaquinone biosynthesis C-methylase UbiE
MKNRNFHTQTPRNHYSWGYDSKHRWISYWHQINQVLQTKPKRVLEVGVGSKTVTNYLKAQGIEVITVDIDKDLSPNYVCSVTEISKHFEENSFDTILCAQVLEHLPFENFEKALGELQKVTKKYLILSLPWFGINFRITFKFPLWREKHLFFKLPLPLTHKFDGEHYWEIGKRNYSPSKIFGIIKKYFEIERRYIIPETPSHTFILKKK